LNKKGNIWDVGFTFTELLLFVFAILVIGTVTIAISSGLTSGGFVPAGSSIIDRMQNFGTQFDWASPMIYIGLLIVSVIFARTIASNVIFFVVGLFVVPFVGAIIMFLSYLFEQFIGITEFSITAGQLPITTFMFTGITPMILALIYIFVVYISLFAGKNE